MFTGGRIRDPLPSGTLPPFPVRAACDFFDDYYAGRDADGCIYSSVGRAPREKAGIGIRQVCESNRQLKLLSNCQYGRVTQTPCAVAYDHSAHTNRIHNTTVVKER